MRPASKSSTPSIDTRRRGRRAIPPSHLLLLAAVYLMWIVGPVAPALAADPITIVITDTLDPSSVTVEVGTTITWRNDDGERHRMRSTSGPEEFDSGNLEPGETFSFTPTIAGTLSYLDDRNDEDAAYFGTIVVSDDPVDGPPAPPPAGDLVVDVVNRLFVPADVTVALGSTVTWDNIDDRAHTVTATDGSFDSGIFDVGASYSRAFDAAGVYAYLCTLHPEMVGTVTVLAEDGTEPPPPPPPDPTPPPAPAPPPPPPPAGEVSIFDNGFTPLTLTVDTGSTVTWTNTGAIPHTVTDAAGSFDSGFLLAGETYARTFDAAGTFNYLCTIHPEMTATVVVVGADGEAPPPAPPAPPPPAPDPPPAPPPAAGGVTIADNSFTPATLTVTVGSTVTWANSGALPHTVTDAAGSFDSGILLAAETYSRTFTTAGTFAYLCTIHPEMTGTVTVLGEDGTAPPPADPLPDPAGSADPPRDAAGPSSVSIVDNDYRPSRLSVAAGSTLTWVNNGDLPHTVTDAGGSFDSGILMPGDGYRRTFSDPGTYSYLCTIHPEMTATITVTAGGTPTGGGEGGDGVILGDASADPPPAARGASGDSAGETFGIAVIDLDYDPQASIVPIGTTVVWTNEGALPHTVTAAGLFDSGIMNSGDQFAYTFDEPGTYVYLCTLHPGMEGRVVVDVDVLASGVAGLTPEPGDQSAAPAAPSPSAGGRFSPTDAIVVAVGVIGAVLALAYGLGTFSKRPVDGP